MYETDYYHFNCYGCNHFDFETVFPLWHNEWSNNALTMHRRRTCKKNSKVYHKVLIMRKDRITNTMYILLYAFTVDSYSIKSKDVWFGIIKVYWLLWLDL